MQDLGQKFRLEKHRKPFIAFLNRVRTELSPQLSEVEKLRRTIVKFEAQP